MSHGPAECVRRSAFQMTERYLALVREAVRSDDRVYFGESLPACGTLFPHQQPRQRR